MSRRLSGVIIGRSVFVGALAIVSAGFMVSSASALTYSSDVDVSFTFNSVISVQLSSANIYINNLAPGTASDSNIITVGANTNASAGFQLSATVGVKNGTTALVNNSDNNYTFSNLSSTKAALANFSDNTWGYSYCANTAANCNGGSGTWVSGNAGSAVAGYNGLPLDNNTNADERGKGGVTLISTTGTQGELNTVQFKIGAKASNSQVAGTYTNTINFYAVANPEPMTIHDVVYMQNFATMTASDKANILNSMTTGAQYQLKDNRDEKSYYISKLADGNVWMTQNLDLNLSSSTTYTNQNTDIGYNTSTGAYNAASWTPARSTYAATSTHIHQWEGDNSPESYDPGNLYWNLEIDDNYSDWSSYLNSCDYSTSIPSCDQSLNPISTYTSSTGVNQYHLGNYYNWVAAVATNDASIYGVYNDNTGEYENLVAHQSICPAGWTLPYATYNQSLNRAEGDFVNLWTEYGLDSDYYSFNDITNLTSSPMYFSFSGGTGGILTNIGESSRFQSSVAEDGYFVK